MYELVITASSNRFILHFVFIPYSIYSMELRLNILFIVDVPFCLRLQSAIFFIIRYVSAYNYSWRNLSQPEDKLICLCCWHLFFCLFFFFLNHFHSSLPFVLISVYHIFVHSTFHKTYLIIIKVKYSKNA